MPLPDGKPAALPDFQTALKFIEIKDDGDHPAWWPCVEFENTGQLKSAVSQLGLCPSVKEKAEWALDHIAHMKTRPNTAYTDRVAWLLGENTPNDKRCVFLTGDDAPKLELFVGESIVNLLEKYQDHAAFTHATLHVAPRFLEIAQKALNQESAAATNEAAVNAKGTQNQATTDNETSNEAEPMEVEAPSREED